MFTVTTLSCKSIEFKKKFTNLHALGKITRKIKSDEKPHPNQ